MGDSMQKRTTTRLARGLFLERDVERFREQLARFKPFQSRRPPAASLEEFDLATDQLISEVFGEASEMVEAYQYAKLGEASSLVNLPEEAQESGAQDLDRESLQQRKRVLESCICELEACRSGVPGKPAGNSKPAIGPRVADYMSSDLRSVHLDATIKEAARLLQKWKVGSLLVDDGLRYLGIITDTDLSRKAVARGLDPNATRVRICMSKPVITVEDSELLTDAVRLMRDKAIRHLAVTEDRTIIGVLSLSDVIRYYSGIA